MRGQWHLSAWPTAVGHRAVALGAYLYGAFACSPFEVKVGTECGNQKVRAWGPGLEGGIVGKSADFVVEAIGDDVGTLGKLEASKWVPGLEGGKGSLSQGSRASIELMAVVRFLCGRSITGKD